MIFLAVSKGVIVASFFVAITHVSCWWYGCPFSSFLSSPPLPSSSSLINIHTETTKQKTVGRQRFIAAPSLTLPHLAGESTRDRFSTRGKTKELNHNYGVRERTTKAALIRCQACSAKKSFPGAPHPCFSTIPEEDDNVQRSSSIETLSVHAPDDDESNAFLSTVPVNPLLRKSSATTSRTVVRRRQVRRPSKSWEDMYHELLLYREQYGNVDVPAKYHRLGPWVSRQRGLYKRIVVRLREDREGEEETTQDTKREGHQYQRQMNTSPLTKERIELLNQIGFCWDINEAKWERRYEELCQFQIRYGHCHVAPNQGGSSALTSWVNEQRYKYQKQMKRNDGKDDEIESEQSRQCRRERRGVPLTPKQIGKLNRIGFLWESPWSINAEGSRWISRYHDLCEYKEHYGDCMVPVDYVVLGDEGDRKDKARRIGRRCLGRWVSKQREHYKNRQRWEQQEQKRQEQQQHGKITIVEPDDEIFSLLTKERIQRLDDLGFLWNVSRTEWNRQYENLVMFSKENGGCNVPSPYDDDRSLGAWAETQRNQVRRFLSGNESTCILTRLQLEKLMKIGFIPDKELGDGEDTGADDVITGEEEVEQEEQGEALSAASDDGEKDIFSSVSKRRANWKRRYDELRRYYEQYGNCLVPNDFSLNPALARWVSTQRIRYKRLKKYLQEVERSSFPHKNGENSNSSTLSNKTSKDGDDIGLERIRLLDEIGFVWDAREARWTERYLELCDLKNRNGHSEIWDIRSDGCIEKGDNIGRLAAWVSKQRHQYWLLQRKNSNTTAVSLTKDRIAKLESIGFNWNAGYDDNEQESEEKESNIKRLRARRRRSREEFHNRRWIDRFDELCEYRYEHGDCLVPFLYQANPSLGYWVRNQREQYRRLLSGKSSSLNKQRIAVLEGIGFIWNVDEYQWKNRYDELCEFEKIHGHCLVPECYAENLELGIWVMNQRTLRRDVVRGNRKNTTVVAARIDALNRIGFVWDCTERNWSDMFELLTEYKELNGHCTVPASDYDYRFLRAWSMNQRFEYRKMQVSRKGITTMTPERIKKLENIDFQWTVPRTNKAGGPSRDEWSNLLKQMRQTGIGGPNAKTKKHWFDGVRRPSGEEWESEEVETDVLSLWNKGDEDEDGDENEER